MSRLYDRLMRVWRPGGNYAMHDMLPHATVVEASNVAAYYAENILEHGQSRMSLMDNPTGWLSPFKQTFFEWRPPRGWYSDAPPYYAVGWHVTTLDREALQAAPEQERAGFHEYLCANGYSRVADDIRWFCTASLLVEGRKGSIGGPMLTLDYGLDHDAEMVLLDGVDEPSLNFSVPKVLIEENEDRLELIKSVTAEWQVVTLAIAFMHCKNVQLLPNEPPRKPSKRAERKHGAPLTTYYTLAIEPMKETIRREAGQEPLTVGRALHICRGHFATYSDEKPMFGKYAGMFWKPQHVRGNKKYGEVIKDYAVEAPKGER